MMTHDKSPLVSLDKLDRKILAILQSNGRTSNQDIANKIGLSPAACLRRIKNLEDLGVISGYCAILNLPAIGLGMTVYVDIALDSERAAALQAFETAVSLVPEVLECHLMSGSIDYKLKLVVRDLVDYERVHRSILANLPHVAKINSSFSIRTAIMRYCKL